MSGRYRSSNICLCVLILFLFVSGIALAATSSSLVTTDGKGISGKELKGMLDKYVPEAKSQGTLVVLTQCYGGDMASEVKGSRSKTTVTSATSAGQKASYGGYDDDAAKELKPGSSSDNVHNKGTKGKASGETPIKLGNNISLTPVDPKNGPIKSRHIIVYAGKPDSKAGRDDDQLKQVRNNFANEKNTTVYGVGGDGKAGKNGKSGWNYPGTKAGLEAAMKRVKEEMNAKGVDPTAEQFVMFVTDHGSRKVTTTAPAVAGRVTPPPVQQDSQVVMHMQEQPDNIPQVAVMVHAPETTPVLLCQVTMHNRQTLVYENVRFDEYVDVNLDGFFDPADDGWITRVALDETMYEAMVMMSEFEIDYLIYETGVDVDGVNVDVSLSTGDIAKDEHVPPVVISVPMGELAIEEGGSASYEVSLAYDPTVPVELRIEASPELIVTPDMYVFDPSNYNVPLVVEVVAVDDSEQQGGAGALPREIEIGHTFDSMGANPDYDELPAYVSAYVFDNEVYCGQVGTVYPEGDLNQDCEVNLIDIAEFATNWLDQARPGHYEDFDVVFGFGMMIDPDGTAKVLFVINDAGLQADDVVVEYAGTLVGSGQELIDAIDAGPALTPGMTVDMVVLRDEVPTPLLVPVTEISTHPGFLHVPGGVAVEAVNHDTGKALCDILPEEGSTAVGRLMMSFEEDDVLLAQIGCEDTQGNSFASDVFVIK